MDLQRLIMEIKGGKTHKQIYSWMNYEVSYIPVKNIEFMNVPNGCHNLLKDL